MSFTRKKRFSAYPEYLVPEHAGWAVWSLSMQRWVGPTGEGTAASCPYP